MSSSRFISWSAVLAPRPFVREPPWRWAVVSDVEKKASGRRSCVFRVQHVSITRLHCTRVCFAISVCLIASRLTSAVRSSCSFNHQMYTDHLLGARHCAKL